MLTAMDNPCVTIIGHPTGRLLLARNPYPIDLDAVMEKALERGIAVEINADPHRLDLDWRLAREARDRGANITIGADAHSVSTIRYVDGGIRIARKAWLSSDDVLNALPVEQFTARMSRVRS
jgi:DNA polymerase (family 10)